MNNRARSLSVRKKKKRKKKTSGGQTEFHWSNSIPIFDAWTKAAAFRVVSPFCGQQGGGDTNTSTTNLRRGHEAWRCLTRNTVKGLDGEKRGEAKNKMFQDIKDSSRIDTVKFTNLPLRDFQRRSHPPLAFSRPLLVPPRHYFPQWECLSSFPPHFCESLSYCFKHFYFLLYLSLSLDYRVINNIDVHTKFERLKIKLSNLFEKCWLKWSDTHIQVATIESESSLVSPASTSIGNGVPDWFRVILIHEARRAKILERRHRTVHSAHDPRRDSQRWRRIDRHERLDRVATARIEHDLRSLGSRPEPFTTTLHNEWLIKRQRFALLYSRSQKFLLFPNGIHLKREICSELRPSFHYFIQKKKFLRVVTIFNLVRYRFCRNVVRANLLERNFCGWLYALHSCRMFLWLNIVARDNRRPRVSYRNNGGKMVERNFIPSPFLLDGEREGGVGISGDRILIGMKCAEIDSYRAGIFFYGKHESDCIPLKPLLEVLC